MKKKREGSALMIVLWSIAIMSAAILGLVQFMEMGLSEAAAQSKNFRALQLAESGLALGLHPEFGKKDSHLQQKVASGESFTVTIKNEGARININSLLREERRPVLEALLHRWGVKDRDVDPLIDHLMDWVDSDSSRRLNGAENESYAKEGVSQFPPNRPFQSLDEMELVPGMESLNKIKPDWKNYLTVFGDGRLDINEAPAELIACICGTGDVRAEALVRRRLGPDGEIDTEDDFKFADMAQVKGELGLSEEQFKEVEKRITLNGEYNRITSVGKTGDFQRSIEVVVKVRKLTAVSSAAEAVSPGQIQYLTWVEK